MPRQYVFDEGTLRVYAGSAFQPEDGLESGNEDPIIDEMREAIEQGLDAVRHKIEEQFKDRIPGLHVEVL